jgi:prevent-host-death family protein
MTHRTYSLKEFSANPSRVIHEAMRGEEEVIITLRGIPAVRLVPAAGPPAEVSLESLWEAMPGMTVPSGPMVLPRKRLALAGSGPTGAEMILEDRR